MTSQILYKNYHYTEMKFSLEDFFSKCDQVRRKLRIWSHLLKKFLMENFIFSAVYFASPSGDLHYPARTPVQS